MTPLALRVKAKIQESGGWIGADTFMQMALYAPGLGYYSGGADPFGPAGESFETGRGDFLTAPMLGPWLAHALWDWAGPLRRQLADDTAPFRIREFGAGRGDLAAALLRLAAANRSAGESTSPIAIEMIELSADLRHRQQLATQGLGSVSWSSELTPGFSGLVLANEVLDAMPVQCFEWAGGDRVLEWGVGCSDHDELIWVSKAADESLQQVVMARQQAAAIRGLPWDVGYRGEHCAWVAPWCKSLAQSMDRGAVLLIDYGYAMPELDHPGRTQGTLCAHYQHQRLDRPEDLLKRIGQQDLTAHVDFSLVAQAANAAGFEVSGFVTQARFLMNAGLLNFAQPLIDQAQDVMTKTRLLQSLQMLLSESEMGEVFKVMLLTKNLPTDCVDALCAAGFVSGDRRESL